MIDDKQFRITNLVQYAADGWWIQEYVGKPLVIDEDNHCDILGIPSRYDPIELTAEWLEKMGFVEDRNGWILPNTQSHR